MDSWYYGVPTLTFWNFFKFNVLTEGSALFGVSPPSEYIMNFIPRQLKIMYYFTILGFFYYLYKSFKVRRLPHVPIIITLYLVTLSMIKHKEDRFTIALVPFFFILASLVLREMLTRKFVLITKLLFITFGVLNLVEFPQ